MQNDNKTKQVSLREPISEQRFRELQNNDKTKQVSLRELTPAEAAAIRRDPPLNMSLREASTYLGCSKRKLRYDAKARLVPHIKLGGKLIFRRDALNEALKRLEIRAVV